MLALLNACETAWTVLPRRRENNHASKLHDERPARLPKGHSSSAVAGPSGSPTFGIVVRESQHRLRTDASSIGFLGTDARHHRTIWNDN